MKRLPLFCWSFMPWCCLGLSQQFIFTFMVFCYALPCISIDFPPISCLNSLCLFIIPFWPFSHPILLLSMDLHPYIEWSQGHLPIFHSSAGHCKACIVVDGWEMATAYSLPSKRGSSLACQLPYGVFSHGGLQSMGRNSHFSLFLVCCYTLPYALFNFTFPCQSFAHQLIISGHVLW